MADDIRKQRYDIAAIPWEVHSRDPSIILGSVKQLVQARGEIGDLVVILVPQGTASDTSRFIGRQMDARTDDLPPGLPGGPPT